MTENLNQLKVAAVVAEDRRRKELLSKLFADSFPEQVAFVMDRSRRKAALTTRRAGKSMSNAMSFIETDTRYPGSNMLYVGVSAEVAIKIIWKDCLEVMAKKVGLKLTINRQRREITFPSGSKLYIIGIDSNEDEKKKALGVKYSLVIIDEAATYNIDMEEFVYDICEPTVSDYEEGQIVLTGMPNNNIYSFFCKITTTQKGNWTLHKWSALNNPHMRDKFRRMMDYAKKTNPGIEETPGYKQMYLGEWAVDEDKLVYKYKTERNDFIELPPHSKWHHVLGIDLGWEDATAFVVNAYRDYDPVTYVVHAYKRSGMQLGEVADYIKHLRGVYKPERMIVDNASKQAVKDIQQRIGQPLEPAEKAGKADFIGILNNDMILGNIKFQVDATKDLIAQMQGLTWSQKHLLKGKRIEDQSAENDLCDAFLYTWRYCFTWVDRGTEPDPLTQETELEEATERQVLDQIAARAEDEEALYGGSHEDSEYY